MDVSYKTHEGIGEAREAGGETERASRRIAVTRTGAVDRIAALLSDVSGIQRTCSCSLVRALPLGTCPMSAISARVNVIQSLFHVHTPIVMNCPMSVNLITRLNK